MGKIHNAAELMKFVVGVDHNLGSQPTKKVGPVRQVITRLTNISRDIQGGAITGTFKESIESLYEIVYIHDRRVSKKERVISITAHKDKAFHDLKHFLRLHNLCVSDTAKTRILLVKVAAMHEFMLPALWRD